MKSIVIIVLAIAAVIFGGSYAVQYSKQRSEETRQAWVTRWAKESRQEAVILKAIDELSERGQELDRKLVLSRNYQHFVEDHQTPSVFRTKLKENRYQFFGRETFEEMLRKVREATAEVIKLDYMLERLRKTDPNLTTWGFRSPILTKEERAEIYATIDGIFVPLEGELKALDSFTFTDIPPAELKARIENYDAIKK